MHPFQLEQLVRKLDARVTRMEQYLPSLATKEDLHEAVARLATKDELLNGLENARRYALMLNEATRDDIRLLAEHVAGLRTQLDGVVVKLERLTADVREFIGGR